MIKWRSIASIILIFLLGMLAGMLLNHKIYQNKIERFITNEPSSMEKFIIERLNRELNLEPSQLEQVRNIVQDTHEQIRKIRQQCRPQVEEIITRSQNRVRALLHPVQLEKYEKFIAHHRGRRMHRGLDH